MLRPGLNRLEKGRLSGGIRQIAGLFRKNVVSFSAQAVSQCRCYSGLDQVFSERPQGKTAKTYLTVT